MLDWILKQVMTWYVDRDVARGRDCFPGWIRRRIQNSRSLQLHERSLRSISMSLRRASSEHLEECTSFLRSQDVPSMVQPHEVPEVNRAPRRVLGPQATRPSVQGWGMWPRLSLAICSIAVLVVGARWTYVLLTTVVTTDNLVQNSPTNRKIVDKRDADRLWRSSLAIGQRWSQDLESKKNSMKREVDQLDRKFAAEAKELRQRSVHFVTHHVPVSAVRMFLPNGDTDTN